MKVKKSPLLIIGLAGLAITAAMQAGMGLTGASPAGAAPGLWLTLYCAWLGFTVVGLVLSRKG